MNSPRNATLGEEIYRDIDDNEYLHELYANILYNYSLTVLGKNEPPKEVCLEDALRFADILSKSAYMDNSEKHKSWAQEIIALLGELYPDEQIVKDYAASVLTSIGNFRGLQLISSNLPQKSFLEELFSSFEMEYLSIPHQENKYFFHSQKAIYDRVVSASKEIYKINGDLAASPAKRIANMLQRQKDNLISEIQALIEKVYRLDF